MHKVLLLTLTEWCRDIPLDPEIKTKISRADWVFLSPKACFYLLHYPQCPGSRLTPAAALRSTYSSLVNSLLSDSKETEVFNFKLSVSFEDFYKKSHRSSGDTEGFIHFPHVQLCFQTPGNWLMCETDGFYNERQLILFHFSLYVFITSLESLQLKQWYNILGKTSWACCIIAACL